MTVAAVYAALAAVSAARVGAALRHGRRSYLARRAANPGASWWDLSR
jgi:hypothetical protein